MYESAIISALIDKLNVIVINIVAVMILPIFCILFIVFMTRKIIIDWRLKKISINDFHNVRKKT